MKREFGKAAFLDRDGTINLEKEYLFRIEDFEFVPGVPEALKMLKDAGYLIVVVTNQSGIARGYYGEPELERLHRYLDSLLAGFGVSVDAYYYCPHHPLKGVGEYLKDCDCRKPKPGMLLRAAKDLDIDLSKSWMIGDKMADIEAGVAAGCKAAMVLSGYGVIESKKIIHGIPVYIDLLDAVKHIVCEEGGVYENSAIMV